MQSHAQKKNRKKFSATRQEIGIDKRGKSEDNKRVINERIKKMTQLDEIVERLSGKARELQEEVVQNLLEGNASIALKLHKDLLFAKEDAEYWKKSYFKVREENVKNMQLLDKLEDANNKMENMLIESGSREVKWRKKYKKLKRKCSSAADKIRKKNNT